MSPLTKPRHRAWRALLSALAGGGLTAASLGGPLSGGALGADAPASPPTSTDGVSTPVAAPTSGAGAQATGTAQQPATSTSTAPAATTPPTNPPAPSGTTPAVSEAPTVVLQRRQKTTAGGQGKSPTTSVTHALPNSIPQTAAGAHAPQGAVASGPNGVAPPPQLLAGQAGALAAELATSAASAQALAFYRIPLFLLPIYQAAAVQYGVPWQILAAINEIETDYGSDQSVSTAGAVGWMQFMPATWAQYGVDALNAGYADPYNPVDAIFAAARYLRAAGAQSNLRTAILAYNHSDEYANSVLLRAKLISSYPKAVIATLTGLTDGRLPVTGKQVAWSSILSAISSSSATANAAAVPSAGSTGRGSAGGAISSDGASGSSGGASGANGGAKGAVVQLATPNAASSGPSAAIPGSSAPPSPAVAAAAATGAGTTAATAQRFVDLMSAPDAAVVAVQDGRIVQLGHSRKLGAYVILRDVYGDLFTYAGLGSIAPSYRLPKAPHAVTKTSAAAAASTHDPAPARPASAGRQLPVTLRVKTPSRPTPANPIAAGAGHVSVPANSTESVSAGTGKVRLFAHPGNPDALASAANAARGASHTGAGHPLPLRRGSVVAKGVVLGHVRVPPGARDGHLRFAIRPAGDPSTIDPRPILANWAQLDAALHPRGAKGETELLGATASEVFLLSKSQLERAVLSDPGISIYACGRQDIASGAIDKRVLAVLAFLSRSGLKPTVSALRCGHSEYTVSGNISEHSTGDAVDISAIDGIPIAGHQGPGTITDVTIRALLTLQGEFVPHQIISLMQYPGAANTLAMPEHWNHIHVGFRPQSAAGPLGATTTGTVARATAASQTTPSPLVMSGDLSTARWNQLIARIAALPAPTVAVKPSSAAIRDQGK
jgi:membrane-bound lytic murein transglycosylase B